MNPTQFQMTWLHFEWDFLIVLFPFEIGFQFTCFPKWIKTENCGYYILIGAGTILTIRNLTDIF